MSTNENLLHPQDVYKKKFQIFTSRLTANSGGEENGILMEDISDIENVV